MSSKIKLSLASLTIFLGRFFFANSAIQVLLEQLTLTTDYQCVLKEIVYLNQVITLDALILQMPLLSRCTYLAEGFGCVHRDGYGNPMDSLLVFQEN